MFISLLKDSLLILQNSWEYSVIWKDKRLKLHVLEHERKSKKTNKKQHLWQKNCELVIWRPGLQFQGWHWSQGPGQVLVKGTLGLSFPSGAMKVNYTSSDFCDSTPLNSTWFVFEHVAYNQLQGKILMHGSKSSNIGLKSFLSIKQKSLFTHH